MFLTVKLKNTPTITLKQHFCTCLRQNYSTNGVNLTTRVGFAVATLAVLGTCKTNFRSYFSGITLITPVTQGHAGTYSRMQAIMRALKVNRSKKSFNKLQGEEFRLFDG